MIEARQVALAATGPRTQYKEFSQLCRLALAQTHYRTVKRSYQGIVQGEPIELILSSGLY